MNFGAIPSSPAVGIGSMTSVEASYPSSAAAWGSAQTSTTPVNKNMYEFTFSDGKMLVSSGMMTRLCQEGHVFKMLLFGGSGFSERESPNVNNQTLQYYGITKESFQALVFSLRTNNTNIAYKYKLLYESIGGFKTIDKHHMKRMQRKNKKETSCCELNSPHSTTTYKRTINLISDEDEEDSPV